MVEIAERREAARGARLKSHSRVQRYTGIEIMRVTLPTQSFCLSGCRPSAANGGIRPLREDKITQHSLYVLSLARYLSELSTAFFSE